MLSREIEQGIIDLSNGNPGKGKVFNIELGHCPVGLNHHGHLDFGILQNGIRVIEEGLIDSILQGLHVSKGLRQECNRKTKLVLTLSDLHGVCSEARIRIKELLQTDTGLRDIFSCYGLDEGVISSFGCALDNGNIAFQSNGTSLINNRIQVIKRHHNKKGARECFDKNGYILLDISIGDYSGTIMFSPECFENSEILEQGIPLLLGEKGFPQSTQCGPTVTGIQKYIIGNDPNNQIITVDNSLDYNIFQKSIRGQLLLKLLYGKDSSFLTPSTLGQNTFLGPVINKEGSYDSLLERSIDSLKKSGYDKIQLHGEDSILFESKEEPNLTNCSIGICNTK